MNINMGMLTVLSNLPGDDLINSHESIRIFISNNNQVRFSFLMNKLARGVFKKFIRPTDQCNCRSYKKRYVYFSTIQDAVHTSRN